MGEGVPRLMVPAEEKNVVGVTQLEAEQQHDGLERVVPPVHEIPDKDVSRLGRLSCCVRETVPVASSLSTS